MIDVGWLSVGIVLLVAVAGAVWKFAALRSEVSQKWGERVLVDIAGLDEEATQALRQLRDDIDALLGDKEEFDPLHVLADPSKVKAQLVRFSKLTRARARVMTHFKWLLKLGPILLLSVIAFGIGAALGLGHVAGLWSSGDVAAFGWVIMGIGGIATFMGVAAYSYLEYSLSSAETLARSER